MITKQRDTVARHFNNIAPFYDFWKKKSWYYYQELKVLLKNFVPPDKRVLEIGCATGDILASVSPKIGLGVDISREMIKIARRKYPNLIFKHQDIYTLKHQTKFDYILLVDLIDHLDDIYSALKIVKFLCNQDTRVVIATINPFWETALHWAEKIGLKMPEGPHNWVNLENLKNLVKICGLAVEKTGYRVLVPKYIPYVSDFLNRNIEKFWMFKKLGFVQYIICKKSPVKITKHISCSIIIPAYNEEKNLRQCIVRIPAFGKTLEIIVVDDGSTDKTALEVKKIIKYDKRVKLISYAPNRGKAQAVKTGFREAKGELLMILDADMAVPPEELKFFYEIVSSNRARFVNGTRMVYPMENQAMRSLHLIGNIFFSTVFSWLLNQRITDTLCGTKVIFKKDYQKIGLGHEPWGDFDLLFGAGKLGLKIAELPVHYKKRRLGESKMHTLNHGGRLLAMCIKGIYIMKILPLKNKVCLIEC